MVLSLTSEQWLFAWKHKFSIIHTYVYGCDSFFFFFIFLITSTPLFLFYISIVMQLLSLSELRSNTSFSILISSIFHNNYDNSKSVEEEEEFNSAEYKNLFSITLKSLRHFKCRWGGMKTSNYNEERINQRKKKSGELSSDVTINKLFHLKVQVQCCMIAHNKNTSYYDFWFSFIFIQL